MQILKFGHLGYTVHDHKHWPDIFILKLILHLYLKMHHCVALI